MTGCPRASRATQRHRRNPPGSTAAARVCALCAWKCERRWRRSRAGPDPGHALGGGDHSSTGQCFVTWRACPTRLRACRGGQTSRASRSGARAARLWQSAAGQNVRHPGKASLAPGTASAGPALPRPVEPGVVVFRAAASVTGCGWSGPPRPAGRAAPAVRARKAPGRGRAGRRHGAAKAAVARRGEPLSLHGAGAGRGQPEPSSRQSSCWQFRGPPAAQGVPTPPAGKIGEATPRRPGTVPPPGAQPAAAGGGRRRPAARLAPPASAAGRRWQPRFEQAGCPGARVEWRGASPRKGGRCR
jgi:translation initiation factor IF-2